LPADRQKAVPNKKGFAAILNSGKSLSVLEEEVSLSLESFQVSTVINRHHV
jgi:hypothetical protein